MDSYYYLPVLEFINFNLSPDESLLDIEHDAGLSVYRQPLSKYVTQPVPYGHHAFKNIVVHPSLCVVIGTALYPGTICLH